MSRAVNARWCKWDSKWFCRVFCWYDVLYLRDSYSDMQILLDTGLVCLALTKSQSQVNHLAVPRSIAPNSVTYLRAKLHDSVKLVVVPTLDTLPPRLKYDARACK